MLMSNLGLKAILLNIKSSYKDDLGLGSHCRVEAMVVSSMDRRTN